MMSLHTTIQTMQFYIQQKEQNRLKHYLSIDLTIQAMSVYAIVLKDIFLSYQFKPLQNFDSGEIVPI